jgi:hypothetical protein
LQPKITIPPAGELLAMAIAGGKAAIGMEAIVAGKAEMIDSRPSAVESGIGLASEMVEIAAGTTAMTGEMEKEEKAAIDVLSAGIATESVVSEERPPGRALAASRMMLPVVTAERVVATERTASRPSVVAVVTALVSVMATVAGMTAMVVTAGALMTVVTAGTIAETETGMRGPLLPPFPRQRPAASTTTP